MKAILDRNVTDCRCENVEPFLFFVKNSHARPLLFFEVVGHSCILGTLFDSQQMAEFRVTTNPVKFSFNDVLNILFNLIVIELDSRFHL